MQKNELLAAIMDDMMRNESKGNIGLHSFFVSIYVYIAESSIKQMKNKNQSTMTN